MTRARKADPALLEREYVYDAASSPISITQLADNHGMARSHIADMARKGGWYEKRKTVRLTVGEKVLDAMTDRWAETQETIRNRMLEVSIKLLDQAEVDIAEGKIKVRSVRDLATVVATVRILLGDQSVAESAKSPLVIDMETVSMDPAKMAEMLPLLKQLAARAGEDADDDTDPEPGHAGTDAPSSPEGTEQD